MAGRTAVGAAEAFGERAEGTFDAFPGAGLALLLTTPTQAGCVATTAAREIAESPMKTNTAINTARSRPALLSSIMGED